MSQAFDLTGGEHEDLEVLGVTIARGPRRIRLGILPELTGLEQASLV